VVEFDNDGEAVEDDARNGGAGSVSWSKKYYAVRLHDASTGEVLVPSQRQGISVVYEIWRGQQLVEFTPCDVPFDKNGVYFFTAPKFHRTGRFRLVFHVVPAQFYAAPQPGDEGAATAEKKGFNIKPLEFHVQVSPRFTYTGAVAALHKLRAVPYLKQRHREESEAVEVDLDLRFDCDELECLKMGLFTLLNALPKGAFKEGGLTTDEVEGLSEQQQREGLPAATTTSGWTPSLRECWVSHVASATRSQDLMEALLLLELCLDQKWLKPWYRPAQQKMQSAWHLLRLSTPAAVALRLFALDRAILYDKVATRAQRGSRLRNGIQLRGRSSASSRGGGDTKAARVIGRSSRTSLRAAGMTPSKPRGRQSRTSRAAEGRGDDGRSRNPPRRGRPPKKTSGGGSRDLSPGSWEEDDDEEEE
ncbi:unnamed protein product, partial [Ectocarpus sp. 13 AM-2016]